MDDLAELLGPACARCGGADDLECVCLLAEEHDVWCPGISRRMVKDGPRSPEREVVLVDERVCTCTLRGRRATREQMSFETARTAKPT